jgi:hypothetical protein
MALSKEQAEDVLWYWHHMQEYWAQESEIGRHYYRDVELRTFLLKVTNPRVHTLLTNFINSQSETLS